MDGIHQNQLAQGSAVVLVATILTTKLMEWLSLNNTFYGILYISMIQGLEMAYTFINNKDNIELITYTIKSLYNNFSIYYIVCVAFITIGFALIFNSPGYNIDEYLKQIIKFFKRKKNINTKELTLYDINKAVDIAMYMNQYPMYFTGYDDVKRSDISIIQTLMSNVYKTTDGSKWLKRLNETSLPKTEKSIGIDDKKFNVKGSIIWHDYQINATDYGMNKEEKTIHKVNFKYVTIELNVESPALIENYVNDISESVNMEIYQSFIASKVIKTGEYGVEYSTKVIGSMKDYNMDDIKKLFIDSFFHPEKDSLWLMMKTIKLDPNYFYKYGQTPQLNLLLYGPPGTGKSSFAYRTARALGRNIITVDLRLIKKKSDLNNILENPCIDGREYSPNQIIYVFDEFDMTVRYLNAQQIKKNKEESKWKNQIEDLFGPHYDPRIYRNKSKASDVESDDSESSESDDHKDDDENNDEPSDIKKKKNKKKKKNNIDYAVPDDIVLQDLLDILQGPIPVEQRIIIATTNDYDGIKKLCPALFRPGRMTPIFFDVPSKSIMNDICNYYFGTDLDLELNNLIGAKVNRPTSEIIEICLKANMSDKPYDYFKNKMLEILNEK